MTGGKETRQGERKLPVSRDVYTRCKQAHPCAEQEVSRNKRVTSVGETIPGRRITQSTARFHLLCLVTLSSRC